MISSKFLWEDGDIELVDDGTESRQFVEDIRHFIEESRTFHLAGKHNQMTHAHGKHGTALFIGDQMTTPNGVGTMTKVYADLQWGEVILPGVKKKWYKVEELEPVAKPAHPGGGMQTPAGEIHVGDKLHNPNLPGPHTVTALAHGEGLVDFKKHDGSTDFMNPDALHAVNGWSIEHTHQDAIKPATPEWTKVNTGNMLKVGQAMQTPNGVGSYVKKMTESGVVWVHADVPGSKKKWFKAEETYAGAVDGKPHLYTDHKNGTTGTPPPPATTTKVSTAHTSTGVPINVGEKLFDSAGNEYTVGKIHPDGMIDMINMSTGKITQKWHPAMGGMSHEPASAKVAPTSPATTVSKSTAITTSFGQVSVGTKLKFPDDDAEYHVEKIVAKSNGGHDVHVTNSITGESEIHSVASLQKPGFGTKILSSPTSTLPPSSAHIGIGDGTHIGVGHKVMYTNGDVYTVHAISSTGDLDLKDSSGKIHSTMNPMSFVSAGLSADVTSGPKATPTVGSIWSIAGKGTGTVTEITGKWVKIEGVGNKKWFTHDEANAGQQLKVVPAKHGVSHYKAPVGNVVGEADFKNEHFTTNAKGISGWDATSLKWGKELTSLEKNSIKQYTSTIYRQWNAWLRTGQPHAPISNSFKTVPQMMELTDHLDSALRKGKAPDNFIAWRGIRLKYNQVSPILPSDVGKTFTDLGFGSSSVSKHYASEWAGGMKGPLLTIKVPRGTSGAYVGYTSSAGKMEEEWIMPRGTSFRVVSHKNTGGRDYFDLEIVPG